MKKLLISATIAAALGLTGCGGGETLDEIKTNTPVDKPFARIIFDPATANLNVPNDLLMLPNSQLFDFTLNPEGSATFDPANPQHALSALDGWSTHHPFPINMTVPAGLELDSASASSAGGIRIFEATQALEGTTAVCQGIAAEAGAPGVPCSLDNELTYGVDFVTQKADADTVLVIPTKPLKPGQGYVLVVTEELKDSDGRGIKGSTTWDLARQDPTTHPLATADQKQLQGIIDIFMTLLGGEGLQREQVSYAAYFSTQSAGTVLNTAKQLQIAPFAQAFGAALASGADQVTAFQTAAQFLPVLGVADAPIPDAFTALAETLLGAEQLAQLTGIGLGTCEGLIAGLQSPVAQIQQTAASVFPQVAPFCAATLKGGQIDLPYYLSKTNPKGDWWRAACTSGAMLNAMGSEQVAGLIAAGAVGANNELCQAGSQGQLYDLNLAAIGIDDPRNLTKFNPIPAATGIETLQVQVTVPNEAVVGLMAQLTAGSESPVAAITKPAAGWPVVVMQHGITSRKEDMLAITGALAVAGFATVAIDHPLHESRGITLEDGTVVDARNNETTDYMNLASLLTARDNIRQSIVDTLGLRLGLNAVVDTTGGSVSLDRSNVYFLGHSLGGITGTGTVALANTSLSGDLAAFNDMFAIKAATLANPGGGVGGFLLESGSFGNLLKGSLLAASSAEFQAFLPTYMAQVGATAVTGDVLGGAYEVFEQNLTPAQLAEVNATFSSFQFAAQTVIDAGDPNNHAATVVANQTPVHMLEVVGDGGEINLPDQVIPNTTSLPLAGTEPLAAIMGLSGVNVTTPGSGLVRFIEGSHSSLLSPADSAAATLEMQTQVASFFSTANAGSPTIVINNTSVIGQ